MMGTRPTKFFSAASTSSGCRLSAKEEKEISANLPTRIILRYHDSIEINIRIPLSPSLSLNGEERALENIEARLADPALSCVTGLFYSV